ncbi:MAG: nicotinate (nicotinamide) nucleotide adenylyltransferase [Oscillospiraceae bacterium]|jgi:nicotinate-nucleotide adenylyltransferase|nr:nicotinate (nicotinamide) nucleotide adenylyltransferase [Oscillospiraceae bacterium]
MRLGIFGGTFNPIHKGHLRLAENFKNLLSLDKILLIPANIPPHKQAPDLAEGVDRLNMCLLAARDYPFIEVSDMELRREGASYTIDTLEALRRIYPDGEFFLILGGDMFLGFDAWHRFEEIIKNAAVCAAARRDKDCGELAAQRRKLEALGANIIISEAKAFEISSTEIRNAFRARNSGFFSIYLPGNVKKYCECLYLYSGTEAADVLEYKQAIAEMEKPGRVYHSLCVAKEAARLAIIYGANPAKAYRAGILHDILKNVPADKILQLPGASDIIHKDMRELFPMIWHSFAGAEYVRRRFNIGDEDIINAIRYHTTGRGGMSLLEKTLFIADCTSFDRAYGDAGIMRQMAGISADSGMSYALKYIITSILKENRPLLQDTIDAYNDSVCAK